MAAPFAPPAPPPPRRPLLSTRAGVVALSLVVVVAGSVVLVAARTGSPRVGVIEIDVHLQWNRTASEVGPQAASPIRLPHCAGFALERNPLALQVWGQEVDARVATVVLIHYGGPGSFSNGGDDTAVMLLRQGDRAQVRAALAEPLALYELAPGAAQPIVPMAANLTAPHSLEARYLVNSTFETWPEFRASGNFWVEEDHEAEAFGGVAVVNRGPLMCM